MVDVIEEAGMAEGHAEVRGAAFVHCEFDDEYFLFICFDEGFYVCPAEYRSQAYLMSNWNAWCCFAGVVEHRWPHDMYCWLLLAVVKCCLRWSKLMRQEIFQMMFCCDNWQWEERRQVSTYARMHVGIDKDMRWFLGHHLSPFPKSMGNILMTGKNYLEQASILQTKYNDIFKESRESLSPFFIKSLTLSPN